MLRMTTEIKEDSYTNKVFEIIENGTVVLSLLRRGFCFV